ncbi:hypothetical protein COV18_02605 [Candidatus Woesearchaeota archaeon CG10_big_fil_rev_8_21_14_0_10_37_12]|nr:MAG: hypothetical protein COV18_02605 [Candidatus Woesearchaeota archaeon CG10_big_fil_rev_8_21_14_0_10_37_12]
MLDRFHDIPLLRIALFNAQSNSLDQLFGFNPRGEVRSFEELIKQIDQANAAILAIQGYEGSSGLQPLMSAVVALHDAKREMVLGVGSYSDPKNILRTAGFEVRKSGGEQAFRQVMEGESLVDLGNTHFLRDSQRFTARGVERVCMNENYQRLCDLEIPDNIKNALARLTSSAVGSIIEYNHATRRTSVESLLSTPDRDVDFWRNRYESITEQAGDILNLFGLIRFNGGVYRTTLKFQGDQWDYEPGKLPSLSPEQTIRNRTPTHRIENLKRLCDYLNGEGTCEKLAKPHTSKRKLIYDPRTWF